MGQIRGADKPGHSGNVASEPAAPSLLSSFAGLLEGGVLNVFSSAADKKSSSSGSAQQRVGSLQTIPLNHVAETKTTTVSSVDNGVAAEKNSNNSSKLGPTPSKSIMLTRPPSDTTSSESDMPGLERLERSTCAPSSEDETHPEVSRMIR